MDPITVRGLTLGAGHCRVIVPLVAGTAEEALQLAGELSRQHPDLIEWRADHTAGLQGEAGRLTDFLLRLRTQLGDLPLLVTWRTKQEGGELPLSPAEYEQFYRTVCESGCADLIDVELFTEDAARATVFACAKRCGVKVVCSSHDFAKTPPKEEMVSRLCRMRQLGADIAKLAVMPRSRSDVAALLAATAEMTDQHPDTPVITMSMGPLGQVSRVAGGALGSAATFAAAGRASAPGQLALEEVRAALAILEK